MGMPIDPDKLFGLFGEPDDPSRWNERGYDYKRSSTLPNINEKEPVYFLGMFYKLIMNHSNYGPELIKMFRQAIPEIDIKQVESAGEVMLYNKAYDYLIKFDSEDPYHLRALDKENENIEFEVALKLSIKFFEGEEEYEKCAFIKSILDLLLK